MLEASTAEPLPIEPVPGPGPEIDPPGEVVTDPSDIEDAVTDAPDPAPAGAWSVAELLDEAPLGRVAVTIGDIAVPDGCDLRLTSRIEPDDKFSENTAEVAPNSVDVRPNGVDAGLTRYSKLWFRRIADEPGGVGSNPSAWFLATAEGTIETLIRHQADATVSEPTDGPLPDTAEPLPIEPVPGPGPGPGPGPVPGPEIDPPGEVVTDPSDIEDAVTDAPDPAPAGAWSVAELLDEAPLGRVAVTIGDIAVPDGCDLRLTSRIEPDDKFSENTAEVAPNSVDVRPNGVDAGLTRYSKLWFRRIADEPGGVGSKPSAWFLATAEGTIETLIRHQADATVSGPTEGSLPDAAEPLPFLKAQLSAIGASPNIDYGDSYGKSAFGVGTNGAYSGWSFPAAALTSHYFGDTAMGSTSSDALALKKLRHIISAGAGNDPSVEGGYRLQHNCRAAVAIAFIRSTPRLWNELGQREKACCDALMIGHLVCATTTGSDNSTIRDRDLRGKIYPSQPRSQNPNFSLNIPGALYACMLYFGGDAACLSILGSFDASEFRARLGPKQLDLANAYKTYTYRTSGLERSSTAPTDAQIERSCRNFVFYGRKLGDAEGFAQYVIDENMSDPVIEGLYHNGKPYAHRKAVRPEDGKLGIPVQGADPTTDRRGRTEKNPMNNPWRGEMGMFKEFWARDGLGVRSSASYVVQGVRCQMDFTVCALAAGLVDPKSAVWIEYARRMDVAMGDLWYKYVNGYRSLAKNNTVSNNEDFGPGWGSSAANGFGSPDSPGYFFGIYDRILKPQLGIVT